MRSGGLQVCNDCTLRRSRAERTSCTALLILPSPQEWKQSSFNQRRKLLRILLKYIIENQETICKCVAAEGMGMEVVVSFQ